MPKRKREDTEQNVDRIKDQAIRIKASRLKARFDQGVTQLTQALKLARGFDRQKMTRRITQAGSDKSKLERLKAEVDVLNGLQEAQVARKYLLKQCARTKRIAEAEGFVALFGGGEKVLGRLKKEGAIGVAEGNVLGRLMKSGPVSEAVPGIMKGIREVLAVDSERANGLGDITGNINGADRSEAEGLVEPGSEHEDFAGFSDEVMDEVDGTLPKMGQDYDFAEREEDIMLDESEEIPLEAYKDRLAASSDSESDSNVDTRIRGQTHNRLDDMEITSDDEVADQQDNVSLRSASDDDLDTSSHKVSSDKALTNTSFLPTLMHGGYYSGSDSASDVSNDDPSHPSYDPDKSFAAMSKPSRKNRRGQQERRKIAEKKYGSRAKHLLKANGAEGVHSARQALINGNAVKRDQGWDTRRGAVESRDRSGREQKSARDAKPKNRYERRHGVAKIASRRAGTGRIVGGRSTGANSTTITGVRPQATSEKTGNTATAKEKLHPSWEAARKRKMESATVGASSFAGKKTTFD